MNKEKESTTDEMFVEVVKYYYDAWGFPYVFACYSQTSKKWSITWRNPRFFLNETQTDGDTLNESCKKALDFIKRNPSFFNISNESF